MLKGIICIKAESKGICVFVNKTSIEQIESLVKDCFDTQGFILIDLATLI